MLFYPMFLDKYLMIYEGHSIARFMRDIKEEDSVLQYQPKLCDCYIAYRRLNKDIFKNNLPRVRIQLKGFHKSWGECETVENRCTIRLNKRFKNKQYFLMILAHEMVHVYQHYYEYSMGHGATFYSWRPIFAKFCIPLGIGYGSHSINWHAQRKFTQISLR